MRIAQIAPPFVSVPPAGYGGTERVVSLLTEELVRRGHTVTLFASGDSTTSARLIPTADTALWSEPLAGDVSVYWSLTLGEVYTRAARGEFDIIHSHVDTIAFPCAALAPVPTITTLHGRLDLPGLQRVYSLFPRLPIVSISESQRAPLPQACWEATVHNGIDIDRFLFNARGGDYLAFLGRVSAGKGLDRAIQIARRAGLPLKIAARMPLDAVHLPEFAADWDYYQLVVAPLLEQPGVEFLGELGGAAKAEFLANARALLFPIDWPEPFGLVMAESLACGTPVVARARGSVSEIILDGVTGLIGETDDDLVQLCARVHELSRPTCRAEALRRFSPQAMTENYEAVYHRVLRRAGTYLGRVILRLGQTRRSSRQQQDGNDGRAKSLDAQTGLSSSRGL
jgi:glycosyltransferase involved in cell wall biosynthesis